MQNGFCVDAYWHLERDVSSVVFLYSSDRARMIFIRSALAFFQILSKISLISVA